MLARKSHAVAMKLLVCSLVFGLLLTIAENSMRGAQGARMREITVQPSPTGAPVIAAALEAALPGSTVRLRQGMYHETVTISKPVALVG
jgi:hypothetical protein